MNCVTFVSYVKSKIEITTHVCIVYTYVYKCTLHVFIKFFAHYLTHCHTVNATLSVLHINLILMISKL